MKRIFLPIVLFAMMQLPLFAASPVSNVTLSTVSAASHSGMSPVRVRAMGKSDFELLHSLLKEEPFESGRVKMIRVACIGNYFTSSQCADMLSLFSFDSSKLQALEYIASRIIDKRAYDVILNEFSFTSNREEAKELLMGRKHR